MKPYSMLQVIEVFGQGNSSVKSEIVAKILKLMQEDKCDIRTFKFNEFSRFVKVVGET